MPGFEGEPKNDNSENSERDSLFCHAYGQCDNSCLLFGCAFEEMEDMRNWEPDNPETDEI